MDSNLRSALNREFADQIDRTNSAKHLLDRNPTDPLAQRLHSYETGRLEGMAKTLNIFEGYRSEPIPEPVPNARSVTPLTWLWTAIGAVEDLWRRWRHLDRFEMQPGEMVRRPGLANAPGTWRWEQRRGWWWRINDELNITDGPHFTRGNDETQNP